MNPLRWLKQVLGTGNDAPPDPDDLVTLSSSVAEAVAGMWQSTLEDQGVPCRLKSSGALPAYGVPTFDVQVQYKYLTRAREILGLDDEDDASPPIS